MEKNNISCFRQKSNTYNNRKGIRRYSPLECIIYSSIILLAIVYYPVYFFEDNIICRYSIIVIITSISTLIELPFLYRLSWNILIKPIIDVSESQIEKGLIPFITAIVILLALYGINYHILRRVNTILDFSKPEIWYFNVKNTYFQTKYSKRSRSRTKHITTTYYVTFPSLIPHKTFTKKISRELYGSLKIDDVLKLTVKSGLFGAPHYEKLSQELEVDSNLFPYYTIFPVREDKAKDLMEEKHKLNIQKGVYKKR